MKIDLFITAGPLEKSDVIGKSVVVIDVLRSSTSICTALAAGAKGVIPAAGPGEAGEMWTKIGSDTAILAGERGGVKIENFALGNSPSEFSAEAVADRLIIMTTTNGTPIFAKAASAEMVITCGLVNVGAVSQRLAEAGHDVVIVCSGRDGGFSVEDTICGGMIIDLLKTRFDLSTELNDAASLGLLLYQSNRDRLSETVANGEHGRHLSNIGFSADLDTATAVDSVPIIPILIDGRLIRSDNSGSSDI